MTSMFKVDQNQNKGFSISTTAEIVPEQNVVQIFKYNLFCHQCGFAEKDQPNMTQWKVGLLGENTLCETCGSYFQQQQMALAEGRCREACSFLDFLYARHGINQNSLMNQNTGQPFIHESGNPENPTPSTGQKKRGRKPRDHSGYICDHCGIKDTPEWRKGPLGKNTVCNAHGLQYAKAVKRRSDQKKTADEKKHPCSVAMGWDFLLRK